MHPQEGEEDLKNNSGDDEEEKSHYEWDDQEYKANFVHFINEEPSSIPRSEWVQEPLIKW